MTIRLQNLLVIPPVFLILGLAVGLLADRAAKVEILWGLRQESVAIAATVGEMTGGAAIDRLAQGDSAAATRLSTALDQIARHGQVESIIVYSDAKGGAVFSWNRDSTAVSIQPELWERVRGLRGQAVIDDVRAWGPYPEAMVAASAVYPLDGGTEPQGSVAAVIDASRMSSVTHDLRRDFGWLALGVTLIGIAAAFFLSLSIGRQVRELGRVGRSVAAGEYRAPVQVSGVKEVQDLSNILGTMASILADVLTRGRRALLIGDPYQLTHGMAAAYREERLAGTEPPEGVAVGVSTIGQPPPGCFYGWAETPKHAIFWVGELSSDGDRSLDIAVEGAAANKAMTRACSTEAPEDIGPSISKIFPMSSLQVAWFARPPEGLPHTVVAAGSGAPVVKGDTCVIHSFESRHMETLSGSLSLFKDVSTEQAAKEFPLALPQTFSGVVLLVRPLRPNSQGGPS